MSALTPGEPVARLLDARNIETLDVLGPTIEFLSAPEGSDSAPCIMRGTIPPGVSVPLHSHPDPETFVLISGAVEGLAHSAESFHWLQIASGDVFQVPGGAKHAFRNLSAEPAVMIIVSTVKMGRFFREIGRPVIPGGPPPGPPSAEIIWRFLETAARYGYWNATAEENAKLGLSLPPIS